MMHARAERVGSSTLEAQSSAPPAPPRADTVRRRTAAARHPGRTTTLSVIIPTRNEVGQIAGAIASARQCAAQEIIVADGGSSDGTVATAKAHGARVVRAAPGRGVQLSAGAAAAGGDVLLFLHADSRLPPDYLDYVCDALRQPGVVAGAFRLRIDAAQSAFRLIERAVVFRSRVWQMPYGDQGIFLPRAVYERVGGFPPLPVMEDYVLVRRLRRLGRIVTLPIAVTSSARRWLHQGIWRTTLRNQVCVAAYRLGVPADRLAAWRGPD